MTITIEENLLFLDVCSKLTKLTKARNIFVSKTFSCRSWKKRESLNSKFIVVLFILLRIILSLLNCNYLLIGIYIYIYIYIYICNHENNVPSRLSPQWLCGNSCTWAHDVRLRIYIYITLILLLWDLSTLCFVDHLWLLYIYIYIYIYTN